MALLEPPLSLNISAPLSHLFNMASTSAVEYPSADQIIAAVKAIAHALGTSQPYAIVGGAACMLLGSSRLTTDVDLVVPKGETKAARQLLKNQTDHFLVDSRTNHTICLGPPPIEIGILTPPALFREPFDASTGTIDVDGARVLKPTLLLNAKCRSVIDRPGEGKKTTDAQDIKFLLSWCAEHAMLPTAVEVPNATKEFVDYFVATYGGLELWSNAGYDFGSGKSLCSFISFFFLASQIFRT
jgi:hypothetical protein